MTATVTSAVVALKTLSLVLGGSITFHAFTQSYAAARSLAFYEDGLVQFLFWARLPGDTMIILGTLVFAYDMVKKRFTLRSVSAPDGVPAAGTIPDRVMAEDDD